MRRKSHQYYPRNEVPSKCHENVAHHAVPAPPWLLLQRDGIRLPYFSTILFRDTYQQLALGTALKNQEYSAIFDAPDWTLLFAFITPPELINSTVPLFQAIRHQEFEIGVRQNQRAKVPRNLN